MVPFSEVQSKTKSKVNKVNKVNKVKQMKNKYSLLFPLVALTCAMSEATSALEGVGSGASGAPTEIDPLSQAAADIAPPVYPVLAPDRICRFEVHKTTLETSKTNPNYQYLNIILKTTKDYADRDGKTLGQGFKVTKMIGISPIPEKDGKGGRTIDQIKTEIAVFLRAVGKKELSPRVWIDNPGVLDGLQIDCKVGIIPAKGDYAESNSLKPVEQA